MDIAITVCPAASSDAGIISRILTHSIERGCALDHRNAPLIVAAWVRHKSTADVLAWLAQSRLYLNLALLDDKPVGIGMARRDGRIALCYVQPECFRRGVGRALMTDLEAWLQRGRCRRACLNSTYTAVDFYRRLGYRTCAPGFGIAGLVATPMEKLLAQSPCGE